MSEDAAAIGSAVSGGELGAWAESRESGSAPEHAGGSDACSSVARAKWVAIIQHAIAEIDAGRIRAARELFVTFLAAER